MSKPSFNFNQSYEPVSPVDIVDGSRRPRGVGFAEPKEDKQPAVSSCSLRSDSSSSLTPSLKTPRMARFAEATSVNSPVTGPNETRSPFADPSPSMSDNPAKPSDVGFGYINSAPVEQQVIVRSDMNGPASPPLKSALKVPGTPGRHLNPLSPTFKEEQILEKHEEDTEKEQAKDLVCSSFRCKPTLFCMC